MLFRSCIAVALCAAVALLGGAGTATAHDPLSLLPEQCGPKKCYNEVSMYAPDMPPVKLPCATASGALPLGVPQLPMYFEGNFDLCDGFKQAHYCTIKTGQLGIPLNPNNIKDVLPLGEFRLNLCVLKECTSSIIKENINGTIDWVVDKVTQLVPSSASSAEQIRQLIESGLTVSCIDDNHRSLDFVGWLTVSVLILSVLLVLVATVLDAYGREERFPKLVGWYSARKNIVKLTKEVPGDFTAFNGIRCFTMAWIILGHCLLNYNFPPVVNPTAMQRFAASFEFALVRAAEYGVDTFFLMSGFLAAFGLLKQLKKTALTGASYALMLLARYLRLTPAYAFVLFWFFKVMPAMGDGPLWLEQFTPTSGDSSTYCHEHWWTNLLYINNLVPFGVHPQCAGWTWYLANDFQFFMLAPLIVTLHLKGRKRSDFVGRALMWGPCIYLIVQQIVLMIITMVTYDMNGNPTPLTPGGEKWWQWIYQAPWIRVTPYAVGLMTAFIHDIRVERCAKEGTDWKVWDDIRFPARASAFVFSHIAFGGCLALMFALSMGHYFQWRCNDGQVECDAWFGQFYHGFFAMQNWSDGFATFYYSFAYLVWSLCLAVVCYTMFAGQMPMANNILSASIFTPGARLTYVGYLVHIPIQNLLNFSQPRLPFFTGYNIFAQVIAYVAIAYVLSFTIFHLIEKPAMNMVSFLLFSLQGRRTPPSDNDARVQDGSNDNNTTSLLGGNAERRESFADHSRSLQRELSTVADVDQETLMFASPRTVAREAQATNTTSLQGI